ncbi:MAG: aldo/keto reductase [Gemmatimonadaceae bacterium]|nr:aldo/keto reductase [Chitinophagaceae bacterium]
MQKVYISDSGPKVSPAIYGFWRWQTPSDNEVKKMERIIDICLEQGINTFDHADIYGNGLTEEVFGKVINARSIKREDIVLFSRCGLLVPGSGNADVRVRHINTSSNHIVKSVNNSLKKLQTDSLDILFLDHLDPLSNLEETALTLTQLKESGKVKSIGIANFSVFQHQLLASYLRIPIVTNQTELSLLNTTALDNGQIDYIKQKYMRPLASAPLDGGRIANGTDKLAVSVRNKLNELTAKYGADIESIAVAWLIKLGALPLIGTTNEQRIKNIVKAFELQLDHQDWYDLYASSKITG